MTDPGQQPWEQEGPVPGRRRRAAGLRPGVWTLVVAGLLACSSGSAAPEVETVGREAFIEAYVALRTVGLRAPQQLLSEEDRERILSEHGVTQEELFTFIEVHGEEVEYMRDVWNEIEERLNAMRTEPDSSGERS